MKILCFFLNKNLLPLQDDSEKVEQFLHIPLKVEIVLLILVVRTILKKPTPTSMTLLVLKGIKLQIVTSFLVIGHAG